MNATGRLATRYGSGIGVHSGYRDLQGFGRRRINGTNDELVNDIVYQVGALRELARRHDANLQNVESHGVLYLEFAINADRSRGSVWFHSDKPRCLKIAHAMHSALVIQGIRIAPVSELPVKQVRVARG